MKMLKSLISAVYPNKCISCGEIIDEEKYFCDFCEDNIERNNLEDFCMVCGFEKSDCVCNYNVYRFEKIISVFKNEGIAQRTYYKYKFGKREFYSRFFADEMTKAVKKLYSDIKFDYICSVPSSKKILSVSGFDHCKYLAEKLSENLKIHYLKDVLFCVKYKKPQHKSSINQRLVNVDGKYDFKYRIDGANILLVDDVKTTGATLDECAKILLFAGAENVFCVTALSPNIKTKKEKLKNAL